MPLASFVYFAALQHIGEDLERFRHDVPHELDMPNWGLDKEREDSSSSKASQNIQRTQTIPHAEIARDAAYDDRQGREGSQV